MNGKKYRGREQRKRAAALTAILPVTVLLFTSLIAVSCYREKDDLKGEYYRPEAKGDSTVGGEVDDPHSTGPKGDEALSLELTAKTAVTCIADGVVEQVEEGFVAVSGEKTRYETPGGRGFPYTLVTINRGDLNLTYVLVPEKKRYFEFERVAEDVEGSGSTGGNSSADKTSPGHGPPFGGPGGPFGLYFGSENEVSRSLIGTEEVSGWLCKKFKVKEEFLDGTHTRYTEWLAVKLNHLPVKTEYRLKTGGSLYITRWELTEIKRGPPPPDLFTVPEGYVKVKNLSEALK